MHQKVHSLNGQKNFQCDKCGKKLSRKDHLVGHLKTHEPAKTIQCQICFKNIKDMSTHEYPQSTNSEM
jgi:KRAB domain-containing zinc finger protein